MAVDTRNKRASAVGLGLASLLILPLADGAVGHADRQQASSTYAGIVIAEIDTRVAILEVSGSVAVTTAVAGSASTTTDATGTATTSTAVAGDFYGS